MNGPIQMAAKAAPHRRRWRLVALGSVAFILTAGLWTAYARLTHPDRILREARRYLESSTNVRVAIGSASYSLTGGIKLWDVEFRTPKSPADTVSGLAASNRPILSIPEIDIAHDPWSLLGGRLLIKSIIAKQPVITLVHDARLGWGPLAQMFDNLGSVSGAVFAPPPLELRAAQLKLVEHSPTGDRLVEELEVTIRAKQSPEDQRLLDLVWQESANAASGGHSQVDLTTGRLRNVTGGLPPMSIGAVMLAIDAGYDGASALTSLLGLQGQIRAVDYNLISADDDSARPSVTVELKNASLSIPVDAEERALPADQRYLRFVAVNGSAVITSNAVIADFSGRFHDAECVVNATLRGDLQHATSLDDVAFEADLRIPRLDLPRLDSDAPPEQQRFVRRWPQLTNFYADYDPAGRIDVELDIAKAAGRDSFVRVNRAVLTAGGGSASSRHFPYRCEQLSGTVEFTPAGVAIRDLCGVRQMARVCVNVQMSAPKKSAEARLSISATNLPIDDALLNGLPDHHRELLLSFSPSGQIDVSVNMTRPEATEGASAPWTTSTLVSFDRLAATYELLPYPLSELSGQMQIDGDRMRVMDVRGNAGAGSVVLDGVAEFQDHRLSSLEIVVDTRNVAVDEAMLRVLPESVSTPLRSLHPIGFVNAQAALSFDAVRSAPFASITIEPQGMTLRYDGFPISITDVTGRIVVADNRVNVKSLQGRYHQASLTVSGTIDMIPPKPSVDLAIHAGNLLLDEAFRDSAPPAVRDVLSSWKIEDPVTVDAKVASGSSENDLLQWQAGVRLSGATVHHDRFPIPFNEVRAEIMLDPSGIRAEGIGARYGKAAVRVDVSTTRTESGENGFLRIHAMGASMDNGIRDILPKRMRAVWDQLKPDGRLDLQIEELSYTSHSPGESPVWTLRGRAELRDVDFAGPANSTRLNGGVSLGGLLVDRRGGTALSGRIELTRARLSGQDGLDVTGNWLLTHTADGTGRFSLTQLNGRLHDGALSADAEMLFDPRNTGYKLTTTLHGVQITPLLAAWRAQDPNTSAETTEESSSEIRGRLDAYLYLSGDLNRPQSRRGGGRLVVRDGHIYKLPLLLAILNHLDLTIPKDDILDDASVEFFVNGNSAILNDIVLRGDALSLAGSGVYSLPDRSVDLKLVNLGSGRWDSIPVLSELVRNTSRELLELRVTGPITQPTVRASPFRGVTEEFKKLFQKRKPKSTVKGEQ